LIAVPSTSAPSTIGHSPARSSVKAKAKITSPSPQRGVRSTSRIKASRLAASASI
jgi:hypothetical protein